MLRVFLSLLFIVGLGNKLVAQIEVVDATVPPFTPENLITNYFLGAGIKVVSVKYEGAATGVGYFNNALSSIGIQKGLVLTNGFSASTGIGASRKFGVDATGVQIASNDNKVNPIDPDINAILTNISGGTQKSANLSKYTISFIPSADTIRFRYVFASEEYPEFICDRYNDVFGFFISGPGINGPYENNGVNIALIPGTNQPVTINNINLGKGTAACPPKFPQFYNNNDKTNIQPVYDGFLDVFTAQAVVQPCQVYTIKLIVADVGDASYDSGVFLEAKSFGSSAVQVDRYTTSRDNKIVEGCSSGAISFRIPQKADRDIALNCRLIGSAVNGLDFKRIPTTLFIPKGDSVLTIKIAALEDNNREGTESIGFVLERDVCTRDTFWLYISDNDLLAAQRNTLRDTFLCKGQQTMLNGSVNIQIPAGKKFEFSQNSPILTVIPNSGVLPTTLPLLVSNVSPLQFSPEMIESVCVNIQHPWVDDIDMYLIAPNGQFIALSTDNGGSGDNYINTCFSPVASTKISDAQVPFTGTWLPEETFSNLISGNNNPANGIWKLMVIDDQPGLDGVVLNWSITFKSNYTIDYQWSDPKDLSCLDCSVTTVKPNKSTEKYLVVSDSYGCKINDKALITVSDSLKAPDVLCGVTTHNSITFSWGPDPEITNYEVSLNNGQWQNVNGNLLYFVDNLPPGTATSLRVRGLGGSCFARIASKVCTTIPCTTVVPEIMDLRQISCFGRKDASVKIGVRQGGTPPFEYNLGANSNQTGVFENLSAGKYEVYIKDAFTCAAKIEFKIVEPTLMNLKSGADSLKCFGLSNAEALVKVEGGTPPYSYFWSTGAQTDVIQPLPTGKYQVTVTDKNNCVASDSISVYQPQQITFKTLVSAESCKDKNDGEAWITKVSGGVAPYDFLWKNNMGLLVGQKITMLSAGTYSLTVSDSRGCETSSLVRVDILPPVVLKAAVEGVKCHNDENGNIVLTPEGGNPPFGFLWSNGKSGSSLLGVGEGIYSVTATDKLNCIVIDSIAIPAIEELKVATKTVEDLKCYGAENGSCTLTVIGGTGAKQYKWSNGGVGNSIGKCSTGFYYVTVTDTNSCRLKDTFFVKQPDSLRIDAIVTPVRCNADKSGAISPKISGGVGPYKLLWSTKDTISALSGLDEGMYSLTVTDANNCNMITDYVVGKANTVSISTTVQNQLCYGTSTGAITLKVSGGNSPYNILWQNGETGSELKGILPAKYSYTVTDAAGCFQKGSAEVLATDSIRISELITPIKCSKTNSASIKLNVSGGTRPYNISLNGAPFSNDVFFEKLAAGKYLIALIDSNGCTAQRQFEISERLPMELFIPKDTAIFSGDTVWVTPKYINNQGSVKFNWLPNSGDLVICDSCKFTGLFPKTSTTYQIRAVDSAGCIAQSTINVKVVRRNEIHVPSGFSPNNDGQNDLLVIFGTKGAEIERFEIFDQWGELLYLSNYHPVNDTNFGWDGTFNGATMPNGTYIWQGKVRYIDGTIRFEKGAFTLLR